MGKSAEKQTITEDVVRYVAKLSRLELGKEEGNNFQGQLSAILDYIEQLNEVDTEDTLPTTHALSSLKNVFREDEPKESLSPEEFLDNAPAKYKNFFKVPKIIKSE
ncbi:Asp-tRNA(Asn)/Glu-tRNA(Gln) amidotransferase subunit GatC [Candidatus Omnitrophota bacterium]